MKHKVFSSAVILQVHRVLIRLLPVVAGKQPILFGAVVVRSNLVSMPGRLCLKFFSKCWCQRLARSLRSTSNDAKICSRYNGRVVEGWFMQAALRLCHDNFMKMLACNPKSVAASGMPDLPSLFSENLPNPTLSSADEPII